MSEERFDRIDQTLKGINQRFDAVDHRIEDLDRHMHVLHEEAMARIAAIPGYAGATKGDVAELRNEMHERFEPLEDAVRHQSGEIERLKEGRG